MVLQPIDLFHHQYMCHHQYMFQLAMGEVSMSEMKLAADHVIGFLETHDAHFPEFSRGSLRVLKNPQRKAQ